MAPQATDAGFPFQPFNVPLVHSTDRVEFLNQVSDCLTYLRLSIGASFQTIKDRIGQEKQRLTDIQNRANASEQKIQKIQATSHAVVVYSSSKYPVQPNLKNVHKPLINMNSTHPERPAYKYAQGYHGHQPRHIGDPKFSKYFFPFEGKTIPRLPVVDKFSFKNEGLGRLPSQLKSVTDLLLFNTKENPYKSFFSLDNLEGSDKEDKKDASKKALELFPAPVTLRDKNRIGMYGMEQYSFRPAPKQITFSDIPTHLPGLKNVALDIALTAEPTPIAPSTHMAQQLPTVAPLPPMQIVHNNHNSNHIRLCPSSSRHPTASDHRRRHFWEYPSPPPLPPPDATPPKPKPESSDDEEEEKKPAKPATGGGGRNDLLAAIRAGTKLKSSKKQKEEEESQPKKKPKKAGPVTMMDELALRLARMRKGITGKADDDDKNDDDDGPVRKIVIPEKKKEVNTFVMPTLKSTKKGEEAKPEEKTEKPEEPAEEPKQSAAPPQLPSLKALHKPTMSDDDDDDIPIPMPKKVDPKPAPAPAKADPPKPSQSPDPAAASIMQGLFKLKGLQQAIDEQDASSDDDMPNWDD
ncbi:putative WASH complex subunit 1 [Blattamonas nauphoetae]|uniref:WASH complex subunit 1 n=1 Tax=Blattamonas nauphoetae TaxID=2049346 RepID=A0ABQ9Y9M9_9EUKA|nr:putative WASH complex subunit 1 [Blattamonas nauphoetae]